MFVDMRFGADFSSVASSYLRILVLNIGLMWSWVFVFWFLNVWKQSHKAYCAQITEGGGAHKNPPEHGAPQLPTHSSLKEK